MKKYFWGLLFVFYYSLLAVVVMLMRHRVIIIILVSFVLFSILDLFFLKKIFLSKYRFLLMFLYVFLSFLLCGYIMLLFIEDSYCSSFCDKIIHTLLLLIRFIFLDNFFSLVFLGVFILLKIVPCYIFIKNYGILPGKDIQNVITGGTET
jgi:hypothetical protein